jgi:homogentisate 1,2-dioxygenase
MFESCWVYQPTKYAMEIPALQKNYLDCWKGLKPFFSERT